VLESLQFALDGPPSSSGLRGRRRTYHTILKLAEHVLFKMVRYVLLRRLRPELDGRPSSANYSDSSTKL
jgi:hypothetical protein